VNYTKDDFGRQFAELALLTGIMFSGKGGHGVYRDVGISGPQPA
jgi:hypothetical protein